MKVLRYLNHKKQQDNHEIFIIKFLQFILIAPDKFFYSIVQVTRACRGFLKFLRFIVYITWEESYITFNDNRLSFRQKFMNAYLFATERRAHAVPLHKNYSGFLQRATPTRVSPCKVLLKYHIALYLLHTYAVLT